MSCVCFKSTVMRIGNWLVFEVDEGFIANIVIVFSSYTYHMNYVTSCGGALLTVMEEGQHSTHRELIPYQISCLDKFVL